MRKIIALGIMLLFLGMTISSSTGLYLEKQSTVATSGGNTLYVGGNGTGNYSKIQDAIDDASGGDTVFVYDNSSPYYENVFVYKSINLLGEKRETTIIDGGGDGNVVIVSADWVNMCRFTIQHCGGQTYVAGIYVTSDNCNFTDNIIANNKRGGISLDYTANNTITGNLFYNNSVGCIRLNHSFSSIVSGNHVLDATGIGVYFRFSKFNIISANTFHNIVTGIWLHYSPYNNIEQNKISSVSGWGITQVYSSNTRITNNWIIDSGWAIDFAETNNVIVSNNRIINNVKGIYLMSPSKNNTFTNNIFMNSSHHGCYVKSSNNYFYHNTFVCGERNAWDCTQNTWDNGYPSGGNYWNDYTGEDQYSGPGQNLTGPDGIGDNPYNIPDIHGSKNKDRYPLMEPRHNFSPYLPSIDGEPWGISNVEYEFTFVTTDFEEEEISYLIDWGDGSCYDWLGPYDSGEPISRSHTWKKEGDFEVRAKAKDSNGYESGWSEPFEIEIFEIKLQPAILFGLVTNKKEMGKYTTVEVEKLLFIGFKPFTMKLYLLNERIVVREFLGRIDEKPTYSIGFGRADVIPTTPVWKYEYEDVNVFIVGRCNYTWSDLWDQGLYIGDLMHCSVETCGEPYERLRIIVYNESLLDTCLMLSNMTKIRVSMWDAEGVFFYRWKTRFKIISIPPMVFIRCHAEKVRINL